MLRFRPGWCWLAPLLLLVTWLGARGLNADAIWYDEYRSIYYAGGAYLGPLAPSEILGRLRAEQAPAYFLLLGAWGSLVGWTPFAARALSLMFGVLAVAVTYRAGRDMGGPGVGRFAAVGLGASAFFVDYLHEMRAYTLYALLTALAVWSYWRLIVPIEGQVLLQDRDSRREDRAPQVIFVLSIAGLLYTHYFASLVVAGIGLYHLLFAPKSRRWRRVLALLVLGGLAFLPWFGVMWGAFTASASNSAPPILAMPMADIPPMLLYAFGNGAPALLVIVAGASLLARARGLWLAWILAACFLVLALAVHALTFAVIHVRYFMGMMPLVALVFGFGAAQLARVRFAPGLALAAWVALGVWNSIAPAFVDTIFGQGNQYIIRRHLPLDTLSDVLHARAQTEDVVALHVPLHDWATWGPFEFYTHDLPARATLTGQVQGQQENDEYYRQAEAFIDGAMRVWLAVERNIEGVLPNFQLAEFERTLQGDYVRCERVFDLPQMTLDLYARTSACCRPPDDVNAAARYRLGESVAITHVEPLPAHVDGALPVLLAWAGENTVPPYVYSVALHVVGADGQLAAQADYGLPLESFACREAEIDMSGVPPGEYTLLVMVYNWGDGQRLPALNVETGERGERLALGAVVVAH